MLHEQPYPGNLDPAGLHTLEVISRASHFNQWMYQTIRPYLKGNILEIGSGIGNISTYLVSDGLAVTLSDYNPAYCRLLKEKFIACENVNSVLSINLQHPDFAAAYAALKETYDTVFLLNVIEHLKDDAAAVINCHYLLKKGGHLILLAPAYQYLYSRFDRELGHYRRYTAQSLRQLYASDLFGIIHSQYFNFTGMIGWFVFGRLLGKKMIGSQEMRLYNRLLFLFKIADSLVLKKTGLSVIAVGKKR